MCRSIKTLRRQESLPSEDEARAAALQYVRKISGFHRPSAANQAGFNGAGEEITAASIRLLVLLKSGNSRTRADAGVKGAPLPAERSGSIG